MGADPGEVNGRFDTRVPAADHGDALFLVERAVAVGAEGHSTAEVFFLAGNAELRHFAPIARMTALVQSTSPPLR